MNSKRTFRHDINGLRAWAVIAVVLFHFGVPGFEGGFVGVDVFFVISGFLMTQIIVSGVTDGKFSLLQFYLARARRIIPALMTMCIVLMIFGWFFLTTIDYTALSKHILTAVFFISNIKFWRESGYFDSASHEKWLLHTWSLSVEWQFYIILPIAILLMCKLWRDTGAAVTIFVGLAISFVLSCYLSITTPSAAFFLLPTRAWEMLAGGAVWWLTRNKEIKKTKARMMELSGLLLIALSILLYNSSMYWPGLYATAPVLGSMFVLAAARQNSIFTSSYFVERIGASSYSIYLWHWPVVVFLTYNNTSDSWVWIVSGIVLSIGLGEVSLRLVENPTRKWLSKQLPWMNFLAITACIAVVGSISMLLLKHNFSGRVPSNIEIIANESTNIKPNRSECFPVSGTTSPSCVYGGKNIKAILVGDSHGDAMTTAIVAALPQKTDGVLDLTYASCPTIFNAKTVPGEAPENQKCYEYNQWERKKLSELDKSLPLIIINRTSSYALGRPTVHGKERTPFVYFSKVYKTPEPDFLYEFKTSLIKTTCELAKERPVYILRPTPEMEMNVPKTISRAMMFGKQAPNISISKDEYMKRHSFVWSAQDEAASLCGVKILDTTAILCKSGRCESTYNSRPIYYDDNHMSEYGNKLLVPLFREIF